ncbi:MAG: sulfite exporter TauE/SafE family protein [Chromatocurvus sp.]
MLGDPVFWLVSVPAVLLFGIGKGGFGGAVAILAVPLMALVMSPVQAAAILLPILVLMDVVVVRTFWGHFDWRALRRLLPGAVLGISLGYYTVGLLDENALRLLVGIVAITFGLLTLFGLQAVTGREHHAGTALFFGTLSGYTSFSIHAGGPPLTMYLLPKSLPPMMFVGTAGVFFATVNALKLYPYYVLGQFDTDNLLYSLVLMPLAPIGVRIGHWLVQHSRPAVYYRIIAVFLVLVGIKLIADGLGFGLAANNMPVVMSVA